jgi:hypothetical protein
MHSSRTWWWKKMHKEGSGFGWKGVMARLVCNWKTVRNQRAQGFFLSLGFGISSWRHGTGRSSIVMVFVSHCTIDKEKTWKN